jgi:hypothetical protein
MATRRQRRAACSACPLNLGSTNATILLGTTALEQELQIAPEDPTNIPIQVTCVN